VAVSVLIIIFCQFIMGVVVNVFNADGTLLISERIREFAHFSLDMKEYSSGVYIVRNGDSTFKIII